MPTPKKKKQKKKLHMYLEPVNTILFLKSLCRCNQVKMRLHWIRALPNTIIAVPIRKGRFGHRHTQREDDMKKYRETAMWRWRQRLQWCIYTLRNSERFWKPPKSRKYATLEPSENMWPCQHFNFKCPVSRIGRQEISVVLSYPVCGSLL